MTHFQPVLNQLNLVVQDMDATVAFYRRLGLAIEAEAGAQHVAVAFPNGMLVEFDSTRLVMQWDSGWRGTSGSGVVLGFSVPSREAVDEIYADLTAAGYRGHQAALRCFLGRPLRNRR